MRQIIPGLWQGNLADLNLLGVPELREKYGFTLAMNVGNSPWVPRDVPTMYLRMYDVAAEDDPERGRNHWQLVLDALVMAAGEVTRGGKVLVVCNMGVSRSVVFSAMVVSILEGIPMMVDPPYIMPSPFDTTNYDLVELVRSPSELMPSLELWADAARALETVKDEIRKLGRA